MHSDQAIAFFSAVTHVAVDILSTLFGRPHRVAENEKHRGIVLDKVVCVRTAKTMSKARNARAECALLCTHVCVMVSFVGKKQLSWRRVRTASIA